MITLLIVFMPQNKTAPNIGLLLWGRTEGHPGIISIFNFGYGVDR